MSFRLIFLDDFINIFLYINQHMNFNCQIVSLFIRKIETNNFI